MKKDNCIKCSVIEKILDYLGIHRIQARALVIALCVGFIIMCLAVGVALVTFSYISAIHLFV